MPSFDVISEVDAHEVDNAVSQAQKEVKGRFDFKGSQAEFSLKENTVQLMADNEFQLKQMFDIIINKFAKRQIDIKCLKVNQPEVAGQHAKQTLEIRQGLDSKLAKSITQKIKTSKLKVQAAIQGNQVRVTGKKRDDLQATISLLKEEPWDLPLQFENFRD